MMKYLFLKIFLYLYLFLAFSSCATSTQMKVQKADEIAITNNFEKKLIEGEGFVFTTYQHISTPEAPYVFYIEGDGSIAKGHAIADNPTPSNPMLLKLATIDYRPNVVYIARPCQYTPLELNPKCRNQDYWVDKRMSQEVVDAMNTAINKINNGKLFSLIGFSGGGGIAVLIAAKNSKVRDIITIAGNLDIDSFSAYHKIYALNNSLNPIRCAKKIAHIPQLHVIGRDDKIVPSNITNNYVQSSLSPCVQQRIFPNITHNKGWYNIWPQILDSFQSFTSTGNLMPS